jgi:3',5'-cyclic AMP phosphodiesterase CpdA
MAGEGATDFTFIHLTDLHLVESEEGQVNGLAPTDRLRRILNRLRAMELSPAFILITGDLVNTGQAAEYQTLNRLLPELQSFGVPVLLGMGNHDARLFFRQFILGEAASSEGQPYYHSTLIHGVNVIMLDSHVPNEVHGYLDTTQLAWLADELAKPVAVGHLIALHHPPVSSTVALLEPLGLHNADALAAVVARHDNVLGILSGHIHYNHVARFANTISFTTPAVLYTIDPGVQKNFRMVDGSGFAIGTVRQGQLFMNTVMVASGETELGYRQL